MSWVISSSSSFSSSLFSNLHKSRSYKQTKILLLFFIEETQTLTHTRTKRARNMNCIVRTHVRLTKQATVFLRCAQAPPSIKRVQNYNWPSRMPNNNWLRQTLSHEEAETFFCQPLATWSTWAAHQRASSTQKCCCCLLYCSVVVAFSSSSANYATLPTKQQLWLMFKTTAALES